MFKYCCVFHIGTTDMCPMWLCVSCTFSVPFGLCSGSVDSFENETCARLYVCFLLQLGTVTSERFALALVHYRPEWFCFSACLLNA